MSDIFEYTDDLQEKYSNVPKEELEALNWLSFEQATELLALLSADPEDRWEYYKSKKLEENNDLDDILDLSDIKKIKELLEKKYWIKIYFWEKKEDSESAYNGYISIFKWNDLVWEIWTDLFNLWNEDYVDSHLWVEVYGEYQWKWFWKLLYKLYKRWSELDENIFFPPEEYATKNSRIKMLLDIWYKLDGVYEKWDFGELTEEEKQKILENIEKNYYDKQNYIYKFIYKE